MRIHHILGWLALTTSATCLVSSCKSEFSGCEVTLECPEVQGTGGTGGTNGDGGEAGGAGTAGSNACGSPCEAPKPLCDGSSGACVACLESTDCTEATAPRCDDGACVGCSEDEHCAGVAGKRTCDTETGACVVCLTEEDCDGNVCSPSTRTCTTLEARAKQVCQPCEHDAECQEGQVCVETSYANPAPGVVGQFCLWRRSAPAPGPAGSCGLNSQPYARSASVTSVDGEDVTVCELRTTTCPALLQHSQTVEGCAGPADNSACGAEAFNDGLCRLNSEDEARCTYPCGGLEDCRPGFICDVGDYCSL